MPRSAAQTSDIHLVPRGASRICEERRNASLHAILTKRRATEPLCQRSPRRPARPRTSARDPTFRPIRARTHSPLSAAHEVQSPLSHLRSMSQRSTRPREHLEAALGVRRVARGRVEPRGPVHSRRSRTCHNTPADTAPAHAAERQEGVQEMWQMGGALARPASELLLAPPLVHSPGTMDKQQRSTTSLPWQGSMISFGGCASSPPQPPPEGSTSLPSVTSTPVASWRHDVGHNFGAEGRRCDGPSRGPRRGGERRATSAIARNTTRVIRRRRSSESMRTLVTRHKAPCCGRLQGRPLKHCQRRAFFIAPSVLASGVHDEHARVSSHGSTSATCCSVWTCPRRRIPTAWRGRFFRSCAKARCFELPSCWEMSTRTPSSSVVYEA